MESNKEEKNVHDKRTKNKKNQHQTNTCAHDSTEIDMIDWSLWRPEPVQANLVQLPLSFGRPQHKFAVVIDNIFT